MLFTGLIAAALWTIPAVPGAEQLEKDFAAVQAAQVDTIVLEFAGCVAENIRGAAPRDEEKGNQDKAAEFLQLASERCGVDEKTAEVRSGLKLKAPDVSETDLDRQTGTAFAFPAIALILMLNSKFEISPPADTPAP